MQRVDIRTLPDGGFAGCAVYLDGDLADEAITLEIRQEHSMPSKVKVDGHRARHGTEVWVNGELRVRDWGPGHDERLALLARLDCC